MVEMKSIQVEQLQQGKLVAQYRKAANISQSKLAEYMHVSVHTVQRLEKEAVIKDYDRRRFLVALLGIPAISMGLGTEQHQRETEMLLFNDDPMLFIEDMGANRWRTHLMGGPRSEEHTSELQSPYDLVCRLLLEKKKKHGTAGLPEETVILQFNGRQ